jgi:hypothetical protein
MLPLLFAVVLGVGAWTAMRRNPAYAKQSMWRPLLVILLAVGAMLLAVVAAVTLTAHKSPMVVGITLGSVIVVGTLAMVFIISSATTPKTAKLTSTLPAGAKLVHLHRQKTYGWAKFLAALVAVLCALGFVLPGNAGFAAFAFAGFSAFLGAILLPIMYVMARKFDVSLTALQCDPWVHWTYTPEQWTRWSNVQAERMEATPPTFIFSRDWKRFLLPFVIIAGGLVLFCPGGWLAKTLWIAATCGSILGLTYWSVVANRSLPEKTRAKLLKAAPEVYFGRDGIFTDGLFLAWVSVNMYLLGASVDTREPRSLVFRFEKSVPNPYGSPQIIAIQQAVLLQTNSEGDVARLQKALRERCPSAEIRLA